MAETGAYFYEAEVQWSRDREGKLGGSSVETISVGAPPEFKGRPGKWSPEQLLVGSVNTCLMLTYLAIAENSKVHTVSYSSTARGKLEKGSGGLQITEIVVKPKVVVASPDELRRLPKILEKAKEGCFISNSIKGAVTLEPEISAGEAQAAAASDTKTEPDQ
ncbi:MAG TPA: OsmC family protein [Candidatus Binatia bacterium]